MSAKKSRWTKILRSDRGKVEKIEAPVIEKVIVKEVPAKVDGEVVGVAIIYEDGTFDLNFNEDISETALAKMRQVQDDFSIANSAMRKEY